jgi:hypothetical protein
MKFLRYAEKIHDAKVGKKSASIKAAAKAEAKAAA